jgi:hypothetical protein
LRPFGHLAPWFEQGNRLYRTFELLEARDPTPGAEVGGRVCGKVNLNTVWDVETLRALCDPQPGNAFTQDEVDAIFARLVALRAPGGMPGPGDRPFRGLGVGHSPAPGDFLNPSPFGDPLFPNGSGINDTLLRSAVPQGDAGTPRLFQVVGAGHPYLEAQLLSKIFNHVTTRSNVFAVWVTVGFFEVTDDSTRPVKLGAEIGRAENRHVSRRCFAVVDRTHLTLAGGAAFQMTSTTAVPGPGPATVTVSAVRGTSGGYPWQLEVGGSLVVDSGPAQETVVVTAVDPKANPPTFRATFQGRHAAGFPITNRGNPGPRARFEPRTHPAVVPYFSIIN